MIRPCAVLVVACALVLLARSPHEGSAASAAARVFNFSRCEVGNSSSNVAAECVATFLRGAGNGRLVLARFFFVACERMEPVLLCGGNGNFSQAEAANCTAVDGCSCGCECRQRLRLRLASASLGPAPDSEANTTVSATPRELATFLGQLDSMKITFSPSSSLGSFLGSSMTGVLEISPQCNVTTWDSDCVLGVSFNSSVVSIGFDSTGAYGWSRAIADLGLHGSVDCVHINGDQNGKVNVMEALHAFVAGGASAISFSNVHIPDCSFTGLNLSSLRYLEIKHSKLPANNCSFKDIEAGGLATLILHNVGLSSVPRYLSTVSNLQTLDLSMNEYMVFHDMASFKAEIVKWNRLTHLTALSLSQVQLGSLSVLRNLIFEPDGTKCTSISNMSQLYLSGCQIRDLEDEHFYRCLASLTTLDLSHNAISTLTPRIFYQLKNITFLSLSHNYIKSLPTIELSNVAALHTFDLSHNRITSLTNFLLSGSTMTLDLSFNAIVEWPKEELFCKSGTYQTWVEYLNISYNSLKTVTRVMGDSLLVLKTVDIRGNKFDCNDCNTTEFKKWLTKTMFKFERLSVVGTNTMSVVCAAPKALAGHNVLNVNIETAHCISSETRNYFVLVVIPLITFVFVLAVIGSVLVYKYRFELAYVRYYWRIKKRKHSLEITETGEYEFDAFVSYSRHDRAWVLDELMEHLETGQENYRLCLHERDFRLGSLILENIESSMRNSRFTLVILSRGFVDSQWCRWELEMANYKLFDDRREFLILLQLEHIENRHIPRHLKYLIETRTFLEWPAPGSPSQRAVFWRRLRRALGESLHQRRRRLSASPPAETAVFTITTTTVTTTATTTTTTVVAAATDKHRDRQASVRSGSKYQDVDKNNNVKAIMSSTTFLTNNVPYNASVVALAHPQLLDESEA